MADSKNTQCHIYNNFWTATTKWYTGICMRARGRHTRVHAWHRSMWRRIVWELENTSSLMSALRTVNDIMGRVGSATEIS